jgi:hypothetical protein
LAQALTISIAGNISVLRRVNAGCVTSGTRTNGRRRNSSTRNVRQSLRHGRGFLCPYARSHRIRTGKCADWYNHHAWNQKSKTLSNKSSGTLFTGQRLLVLVEAAFLACRAAERNSQALLQQAIPTMLRITIYAILVVTLIMGAASAQTDKQGLPGYSNAACIAKEKKNDRELDRAYESMIKGRPDAKQNSDPWAGVRSAHHQRRQRTSKNECALVVSRCAGLLFTSRF